MPSWHFIYHRALALSCARALSLSLSLLFLSLFPTLNPSCMDRNGTKHRIILLHSAPQFIIYSLRLLPGSCFFHFRRTRLEREHNSPQRTHCALLETSFVHLDEVNGTPGRGTTRKDVTGTGPHATARGTVTHSRKRRYVE